MVIKVTLLGSGPSGGVPGFGNDWGMCDPTNEKNRRLRPSILIQTEGKDLLVDTSPDLRQQLLNAQISKLDAVLFTHGHADHLHGIDDLRPVNRAIAKELQVFADKATLADIEARFGYVFEPLAPGAEVIYKPLLVPNEVRAGEKFIAAGCEILALGQNHGWSDTLGFRIGNFAYSTDVVDLAPGSFELLAGIDTWVIGVLVKDPHPTHAHVQKALEWIERVKPRRAYLTHLSAQLDYQNLCEMLPEHVRPAYDGLEITVY